MYSGTEKDGRNTRFLKNIPVRIYSDPDTDWLMVYRSQGLASSKERKGRHLLCIKLNLGELFTP